LIDRLNLADVPLALVLLTPTAVEGAEGGAESAPEGTLGEAFASVDALAAAVGLGLTGVSPVAMLFGCAALAVVVTVCAPGECEGATGG
jgi:hypothetical protein